VNQIITLAQWDEASTDERTALLKAGALLSLADAKRLATRAYENGYNDWPGGKDLTRIKPTYLEDEHGHLQHDHEANHKAIARNSQVAEPMQSIVNTISCVCGHGPAKHQLLGRCCASCVESPRKAQMP